MVEQKEISKSNESEKKEDRATIMGYYLPTNPLVIALIGIFGALIFVITFYIQIPIPATQGILNLGDAAVMLTGLLFGPVVGGLAGGIGSCLADVILCPIYMPATLIIKGLEGFIVGFIADPKRTHKRINYRDILAVVVGGLIMVFGYLIYEIILFGLAAAFVEVILNGFVQYAGGMAVSLLLTIPIRKNLTQALPQVFDNVFIETKSE